MMWRDAPERLALLELLVRGSLKRRKAQTLAWDLLAELPWTRRSGRRDEIALVESRRPELVALLTRAWPGWREGLADLTASGLPPTPEGWTALEDASRAEGLPALPAQLNRRTAAALAAPHAKATLTEARLAALGDTAAMHDGSVRIRPPPGITARSHRGSVDLSAVAEVLGEVSLPERALKEGLSLEGALRAVLLVENLGAFCDLPALEGWLFAHVAGWDTPTVARLLDKIPDVPIVHFGDLDPNGVRIFQHLRERCPRLRWFVPTFWKELVETRGQRGAWPDDLDLSQAPLLLRDLAAGGVWLEQESLVVDPRTPVALAAMV